MATSPNTTNPTIESLVHDWRVLLAWQELECLRATNDEEGNEVCNKTVARQEQLFDQLTEIEPKTTDDVQNLLRLAIVLFKIDELDLTEHEYALELLSRAYKGLHEVERNKRLQDTKPEPPKAIPSVTERPIAAWSFDDLDLVYESLQHASAAFRDGMNQPRCNTESEVFSYISDCWDGLLQEAERVMNIVRMRPPITDADKERKVALILKHIGNGAQDCPPEITDKVLAA